jgi:hypothetical protein
MAILSIFRKLLATVISIGLTVYLCVIVILPPLEKTGLNQGSIAAILIFTAIGLLFLVIGPLIFWISRNFFSILKEYLIH